VVRNAFESAAIHLDRKVADSFVLNPGSIVAMDRGYTDYALFGRSCMAEVYFVTRLKEGASFEVVEECKIPERADQLILLTGAKAQADCPGLLRRIVVWDADNEREIVLLTNLLAFGSTTIASIYKERWQINQNLTVKTFVGTAECRSYPDLVPARPTSIETPMNLGFTL
jgi:hypothetical protein